MKIADSILKTWFEELDEKAWFSQSDAVDVMIKERFLGVYEDIVAKPADISVWLTQPAHSLALVLLLDQFPRNMFRGTARSFAADPLAVDVAEQAIARGHDLDTEIARRGFYYLPFEHSEKLADQDKAVHLFKERADINTFVEYAELHRDIIKQFGRFPHRNAILGRPSTAEEIAYLTDGGHTFGAVASATENDAS